MAKTLTEDVYEKFRDDIISLRVAPGSKVSEAKLAKRFNVSRAPIRSVIERLRQENLVIVKPQVGTIISPVSLPQALQVLEVRQLLEPAAAAAAAERVREADIIELRSQISRLDGEDGDDRKAAAINTEVDRYLHDLVWRRCGNAEIVAILNGYRGIIHRIQLASVSRGERLLPSRTELTAIAEALAGRDQDAARRAMADHLDNVAQSIRQVVLDDGTA